LPGTTVKIADDGEVLIKGPIVMRGYWQNDAANKEVFTED
jgi:long-chain acyl-CoA synthetase